MAFSLPNMSLAGTMDFIFGNVMYFVIAGVIIYVVLNYLKFGMKTKIKPLNRSEVERIEFINRMKENKPNVYKILRRGNHILGKIQSMRIINIEKNPTPTQLCQMVIKPTIWKTNIMNPLAKSVCFSINTNKIQELDRAKGSVELPATMTFDYLFGIYYDGSTENVQTDFIKHDNLFRSDLNQLASIYYAKSQEQSTFDPDKAHALAMKEKELQIEMAKKQGKITSI